MTARRPKRTPAASVARAASAPPAQSTSASRLDDTGEEIGSHPALPFVVLLFVGSGCAALIYEIIWFQMLELIVGSSAVSLGVVLGTFMGGMCLGSAAAARIIPLRHHPLRVYAALEGAIGVCGLLILLVLPHAGGLYAAIALHGAADLIVRGLFCALCLLPPTVLMGATLPAVARWVEATPRGASWLGFFYGGNIAGAVAGALVAGFYLLRVHDVTRATLAAALLNGVVAVAALLLARPLRYELRPSAGMTERPFIAPGTWPVYVTIALSGAVALGAQVIWTRLLSLTLGATVYTFSLILAAFLVGLGIGSSGGSVLARSVEHPRTALGWCQLLAMAGVAWAAFSLTKALPYWPVNPGLATNPLFLFQVDFSRCLWTVLPAAICWGASFPLALAAVAHGGDDAGRLVGGVYAANTIGAIVGAMTASLLLIAWLGTQHSQRILIAVSAVAALVSLVVSGTDGLRRRRLATRNALVAAGTGLAAVVFIAGIGPIPAILVGYGRWAVTWLQSHGEFLYVGEGMNSSMAVSRLPNGVLNYHNAGKVQASSEPQDMRLQRMLGHLTTLIPKNPRSVLVIGCGAGVTAGAVSIDPAVDRETIAELEPLVPRVVSTYFAEHNFDVVRNPKVKVHLDDARHYLLTTDEKFDAVTSDPLDPWVKGAANLYTREFFELVKQRLNPGGVVTVFVQLYESNVEAVKSEIATFLEAFPNGLVFGNTNEGQGYDIVLLGQVEPTRIDLDEIDARLQRPEYGAVAQSLAEIGFHSAADLFSTFAAQGPQLRAWLADAQINRDRNLRLQYLAGLGVNQYRQAEIYREILAYRRVPDGLFVGSPARLAAFNVAMATR